MRPITEILAEFPRVGPPPLGLFAAEALDARPPVPPDHDPEAQARLIAEARQAGADEALAAAECDFAEREAALVAAHEEALVAERGRWAAAEGERLAEQLRTGLASIEGAIAAKLALALAPLVEAAARSRAAEEIVHAIAALLAGAKGTLIEVRGPADLLVPARRAFAGNDAVAIADADDTEVSVRAGDTAIVSQVAAWTASLATAVAMMP